MPVITKMVNISYSVLLCNRAVKQTKIKTILECNKKVSLCMDYKVICLVSGSK